MLLVVSEALAWLHWGLPVLEAMVLAGQVQQLEVQAYYLRWLALLFNENKISCHRCTILFDGPNEELAGRHWPQSTARSVPSEASA